MNLELDDSIPEQNEPDQENSSTSEEYSFTLELPEDDGTGEESDPAAGNGIDDASEAGDEGTDDASSGTTPPENPASEGTPEREPGTEETDKKPKESKDDSPDDSYDSSGGKPPRNIKPGKIILPVICLLIIGAAALAIHLYLKAKDAPQTVVKEFLECAKELDFEGMDACLQSHDLTAFGCPQRSLPGLLPRSQQKNDLHDFRHQCGSRRRNRSSHRTRKIPRQHRCLPRGSLRPAPNGRNNSGK